MFVPIRENYLKGWAIVIRLIREKGLSLSGREANCCFLNTGQTRFANIATISGLDFIDDARGCAVVDWDKDGDLDLWISNRTSPQVRYMRNDVRQAGNFVAFKLVGQKSNRDGIGARVSLTLADDGKAHIKTLRAGEGFLSQSSKWMHFGMGGQDRIQQVHVKWPDGSVNEFDDVDGNQFYRLIQGENLQRVDFAAAPELAARVLPTSPAASTARTVVAPRQKASALKLLTADGQTVDLQQSVTGPTLVNLWSETCPPCLLELSDFAEAADSFKAAGLRVMALRSPDPRDDVAKALDQLRTYQQKLNLSFPMAAATDDTMSKLTEAQNEVLQIDRPLVLPTSFLLDASGRLSVIYQGRVAPDQILADVQRLDLPESKWNDQSVPFPGRWYQSPFAGN